MQLNLAEDDCFDVLVNDSMAIAAHNEDANVALVGHTYAVISLILSKFLHCLNLIENSNLSCGNFQGI